MNRAQNADGTFDLYRYWNWLGELLYVGQSVHAATRMSGHRSIDGWWLEVERVTIERVPAFQIDYREQTAIRSEQPKYNKQWKTDEVQPKVYYPCDCDHPGCHFPVKHSCDISPNCLRNCHLCGNNKYLGDCECESTVEQASELDSYVREMTVIENRYFQQLNEET